MEIHLISILAIPFLGIHLKEILPQEYKEIYMRMLSNNVCNTKKEKKSKVSEHKMSKQNVNNNCVSCKRTLHSRGNELKGAFIEQIFC